MKRFILAIMMAFMFTGSVMAEQVVISVDGKLTDEQKAQLQLQAAQQAGTGRVTTAKAVKEWVDVGSAVGVGLANTARELGVTANDFAKTSVGKLTVFLIAWNYMGHEFVRVTFGFIWLLLAIPTWIWLYRSYMFTKTVTYYDKDKGPNGATKVVNRKHADGATEGGQVCYWLSLIATIAIGFLPIII